MDLVSTIGSNSLERPCTIYPLKHLYQVQGIISCAFLTFLGSVVPEDWKGTLGITYHLGPEFNKGEVEVELNVSNNLEEVPIYNVIGTIYGKEEPDRYVLIGNHRDAWVHGAIDASTGTSATAEIGRVLGELLKTGWRPRRTIKVRQLETYSHGVIFNRISKLP